MGSTRQGLEAQVDVTFEYRERGAGRFNRNHCLTRAAGDSASAEAAHRRRDIHEDSLHRKEMLGQLGNETLIVLEEQEVKAALDHGFVRWSAAR